MNNAAALDAPFSFHCVICIFPFNLHDRPPVVLPCGHTYICEPCSKRLKTCMECRTSLFLKPPPPPPSTNTNPNSISGSPMPRSPRARSSYSTHRKRETQNNYREMIHLNRENNTKPNKKMPPVPVEPISLPIPRNHVMIALMEAADRRKRALFEKSYSYDTDEDDDEDTKNVLNGIEAMHSDCGTYIVRDNQGLAVFPNNPYDTSLKRVPSYLKPPLKLRHGQRVQVVYKVESDVYKLARNEGYIVANDKQFVKVGMPIEKSCEVEGMINTIQSTQESLIKQLSELRVAESNLKQKLQKIVLEPVEHPIIEEVKPISDFLHIDEPDSMLHGDATTDTKTTVEIGSSLSDETWTSLTPASPPPPVSDITNKDIFMNGDVRALSHSALQNRMARSVSPVMKGPFMCGGSLFPNFVTDLQHSDNAGRTLPSFRPQRQRSESQDGGGSPRNNSDFVDFRTGLSGHTALYTSRRKKIGIQNNRRHEVRLMGEHRGISTVGRIRQHYDSPR